MNPTTQLMTADELFMLPTGMGKRYELIRGELKTMAPAGFEHGAIGNNLSFLLTQVVKAKHLGIVTFGDTGFVLSRDPDTVRAPDVAFVCQQRIDQVGVTQKFWVGAPDLAVEVVSPGDTVDEVEDKVQDWLSAGAQLVWVVSPKRKTVTVYQAGRNPMVLSAADSLDGGDVVPGFKTRVGDIFV